MAKKKVLQIGIDPKFIDFSDMPATINAERIRAEGRESYQKMLELGYEIHNCFTDLGKTAATVIIDLLNTHNFDCIMIGAGIRTLNKHVLLFEKIINTIHQHAPSALICFNTRPLDSVDAVQRWC